MSGHTPGPWKWRNHKGSITNCELVGADGTVICVAESGDGGVTADDELIAAAPELLEALEILMDDLGALTNKTELFNRLNDTDAEKVYAAYAKATGAAQ